MTKKKSWEDREVKLSKNTGKKEGAGSTNRKRKQYRKKDARTSNRVDVIKALGVTTRSGGHKKNNGTCRKRRQGLRSPFGGGLHWVRSLNQTGKKDRRGRFEGKLLEMGTLDCQRKSVTQKKRVMKGGGKKKRCACGQQEWKTGAEERVD